MHGIMRREDVASALAGVALVRRIYFFDRIDSTSTWARALIERAGPNAALHGTLIVANEQTAGRGRFNRLWSAPAGKALLFSIIVMPEPGDLDFPSRLSIAAPVAVCDAISRVAGVAAGLKYPNDILIDGRKVAGVLIEQGQQAGAPICILGIGINCNQNLNELPPIVRIPATSIVVTTGHLIDMPTLLQAVLENLATYLDPANRQRLSSRAAAVCVTLGQNVSVQTDVGEVTGVALAITADGALVIRTESGVQRAIYSGDVRQLNTG